MTAINFPDTPSVNDEFTSGDRTWIWDGTVWKAKASVLVGPTGPTGPGVPSQTGNSGKLLTTNGTDASWSNTVIANSDSVNALTVKGAISQAAHLQTWTDSDSSELAYVTPDGSMYTWGTFTAYSGITGQESSTFSSSTGGVALTVQASVSQIDNLQEWKSTLGVLASFSSSGKLTATPATPSNTNSAENVGYVGMPQISVAYAISSTNPNWVTCAGKHIYTTTNGLTHTLPANSSYPFQIGTTFVFINPASVTTTIAIATDTLILAGTGTTGSRTLAPYGMATAVKITSTSWMISGNGLT